ncbi:hypothetical protein [Chamaesiphon sp. VAR_48_metabat_403]|uniref:hypothetical protein n=1 Tax=Chamaesiphon sp. VAR_48_metabat_403 TaxID=2964700 RepID=UPI00286DF69A|nr:hypothetical protein [Chamaesiphon sp. VAR_48_metabat_403]
MKENFLQLSQEQYLAGRYRQFGKTNPEIMEVDFWNAMVSSGCDAYSASQIFDDLPQFDDLDKLNCQPVWCNKRMGQTVTELPDGRIVKIAGEHEDYYDPDFCIYNDVIVYQQNGSFKIFGYPKDIFPPTDFHTATLVEYYIYIIGSIGYQHERVYYETPVYRLHCDTFIIEEVETTGDNPGWISRHQAYYRSPKEISISGGDIYARVKGIEKTIENSEEYTLDLINKSWSKTSA